MQSTEFRCCVEIEKDHDVNKGRPDHCLLEVEQDQLAKISALAVLSHGNLRYGMKTEMEACRVCG